MLSKRNKLLTIFIVILLFSPLIELDDGFFNTKYRENEELIYSNIKTSDLYNTTIQIDDLSGSTIDWEWAESQPWCSGSGSEIDPYMIENQFFIINNSGATCLSIKNSDKFFIIENCLFFDTLLSCSGNGIYMYNITNGKVINNTVHHKYHGIYLDHSNNNLIFGNTLANNQERGILTVESDNNNLSNNQISFSKFGFFLGGGSDYNILMDNNCSENSYGIKLYYADYNSFIRFKLINNGIDVERSNYNKFNTNLIQNGGISLLRSHHTSFNLNDVNNSGSLGYNFLYSSDNILFGNTIISSSLTGISFYEGQRNEIRNNYIENNGEYGIRLYGSIDGTGSCYNNFVNNSILNNQKHGIYLDFSGLNNFYDNTIQGNNECGFFADTSHLVNFENNIVKNNTLHGIDAFSDSLYNIIGNEIKFNGLNGVYLHRYSDLNNIINNTIEENLNVGLSIQDSSHQNNISNNYFIKNGLNAFDSESDNYWNTSYIGNYWDDYTGVDADNDGIGDTPYNILGTAGNFDNLPIWWDSPILEPISPNIDNDGSINLTWNAISGISTFYIYRKNSYIHSIDDLTPIASVSESNYTDNLVTYGTYYYVIVAGNAVVNSSISNCEEVIVIFPLDPPIIDPISPNIDNDGIIYLDWKDISRATKYYIYRTSSYIHSIEDLTPIASVSESNYTDSLVINGTYYYVIVAGNAVVNSSISNCENTTVIIEYGSEDNGNNNRETAIIFVFLISSLSASGIGLSIILILLRKKK